MIVDAHMHIGEWTHADFLGRSCSLDDALTVMADAGIGGAGIMSTDRCDNAGLLGAARALAGRGVGRALWFFSWVRPIDGAHDGASDLQWAVDHAGEVTGLKIHPSLFRRRITDPCYRPALEEAARRGWVVLVHCGRWQEMASYRFAVEAAQAHPQTRFLLAHAGGDTPPLCTAACELVLETGVDNVWFEFSGVREYWVIERNVARLGANRYLMGSDYNLAHPRMYLGAVAGMKLSPSDRERILGGNAQELYGEPLRREDNT